MNIGAQDRPLRHYRDSSSIWAFYPLVQMLRTSTVAGDSAVLAFVNAHPVPPSKPILNRIDPDADKGCRRESSP
jgi:hypothetical protein